MGKPFDSGLARKATERTAELVDLLNRNLKEFRAELGPGKDSDIVITHLTDPPVNVFVEVEIVRGDRWERIRSGEFSTVRWPLAKRYKCENYAREGKLLIMLSANVPCGLIPMVRFSPLRLVPGFLRRYGSQ